MGDADELLVVGSPPGVLRDPDLGEDLVLSDRGLEEVDEEVGRRHGPGPARDPRSRTPRPWPTPGRRCRPPGPRAHSEPPNVPRCRIWLSATSAAAFDSSSACSRTRSSVTMSEWVVMAPITRASPSSRTPRRRVDPADVDDELGSVEPHPQHRQQALPAGDELRVVALRQGLERLLDRGRGDVVEPCGDHCWPSSASKCGIGRLDRLRPPPGRPGARSRPAGASSASRCR